MSAVSSSATAPDLPPGTRGGVLAGEWERAIAALDNAGQVCLACHVRPDGDALGSMLAVAHALSATKARVVVSIGDDPPQVPDNLRFLPGLDLLTRPLDYPVSPEVMITFDASTRGRLGMLAPNAARARELIVVDHHPSNTRFGTIHLVDPTAAATLCRPGDRHGLV